MGPGRLQGRNVVWFIGNTSALYAAVKGSSRGTQRWQGLWPSRVLQPSSGDSASGTSSWTAKLTGLMASPGGGRRMSSARGMDSSRSKCARMKGCGGARYRTCGGRSRSSGGDSPPAVTAEQRWGGNPCGRWSENYPTEPQPESDGTEGRRAEGRTQRTICRPCISPPRTGHARATGGQPEQPRVRAHLSPLTYITCHSVWEAWV